MPVIFGREIPARTLWIGGGLIAVGVAVVVFLRARAASQAAAADQAAPQPDQSAGMTVAAPTGQVADQYQQQLENASLQAQNIANQYQSNLVAQQQKQFEFQMSQEQALSPAELAFQKSQLAVQTHYNTAASKAAVSCPGNASLRTAPDGSLYCRQKTSGNWGPIPVGDISRAVEGFASGVEAATPSIGFTAAQDAAKYELGKVFPASTLPQSNPSQAPRASTPPIAPTQTPFAGSSHGYGDTVLL
jgi:hypothetical protein